MLFMQPIVNIMSHDFFQPYQINKIDAQAEQAEGPLLKRNVKIDKHRTSIRLEPALWHALETIAILQQRSVNDICTEIGSYARGNSFTSAIRVYIVDYLMNQRRRQTEQLYKVEKMADISEELLPA